MMLTLVLAALMLVLGIAALEGFLVVALLRQLPRWHWRFLYLRFHARYAFLLFRLQRRWSKVQCHMPLASPAVADERGEQDGWTWSEMAEVIRLALAMDITYFCQTMQEVAA